MKKVIITGVTGQDGSYMADYLLENTDHQVFGMVRRTSKPDYSNLKDALENPRFSLVTGDLSDSQSIESMVREIQPDYLFNFAAQSFVGDSWKIPEQTFESVAMGTLRCLESIRKFAPQCRFYSAGSSEEMGDVLYSPQDINHPIRPRSPYGAAKAAARHLTKVYRESYNLYAVHCILYNHESERRGIEFVTRKITRNVARIKHALDTGSQFEPLELGNLDSKRDWSHAKDFIRGIWMVINQPKPKDYVLSSGETHSIRSFVEQAFRVAGIEGYWVNGQELQDSRPYDPQKDVFAQRQPNGAYPLLVRVNPKFYRPAEVDLLLGDSTPARTELGWKPEISFDKLVEVMVLSDIDEYCRAEKAKTAQ
jgi:GDPmannose 4,6-dehydratase